MALREVTGDQTKFAPSLCRYDLSLWNSIPPYDAIIPPLYDVTDPRRKRP